MLQERGHGSLQIIKWRVYSSQTEDVVEIAVTMLNYFPWLLVAAALLLSVIFLQKSSCKEKRGSRIETWCHRSSHPIPGRTGNQVRLLDEATQWIWLHFQNNYMFHMPAFMEGATQTVYVPTSINEKLNLLMCLHWITGVKPSMCACHFHLQPHSTFSSCVAKHEAKHPEKSHSDCVDVREGALHFPLPQQKKNPGKHISSVACHSVLLCQICTWSISFV